MEAKIKPKKQKGKVFIFKRLKKSNSKIKKKENLMEIYDKIRMLSSYGYPHAYIIKDNLKILFTKPKLKKKMISCEAKIYKN